MNLKDLLFGRRFRNFVNPVKASTTVATTRIVESVKIPRLKVEEFSFVAICLAIMVSSFLIGFFCWGCLVLFKKRTINAQMAARETEQSIEMNQIEQRVEIIEQNSDQINPYGTRSDQTNSSGTREDQINSSQTRDDQINSSQTRGDQFDSSQRRDDQIHSSVGEIATSFNQSTRPIRIKKQINRWKY
jgi:hypothetical protein